MKSMASIEVKPRMMGRAFGGMLILALTTIMWTSSANAAIFDTHARWAPGADGLVKIPVCIINDSSTGLGLPYTLELAQQHVREALRNSWEKYSSVRFTDWRRCNALSPEEQAKAIGLYISPSPDDENQTITPAKQNLGHTKSKDDYGVRIGAWGRRFNSCRPAPTIHLHGEVVADENDNHFDCVEQYAIHEFGHVLGFEHEWYHPGTPEECTALKQKEGDIALQANVRASFSATPDPQKQYLIVNPNQYDFDSIMTYDPECAHVKGVRFGSKTLDALDIQALQLVYPPPGSPAPSAPPAPPVPSVSPPPETAPDEPAPTDELEPRDESDEDGAADESTPADEPYSPPSAHAEDASRADG